MLPPALRTAGVHTLTDLMRRDVIKQGNVVLATLVPEEIKTSELSKHARVMETLVVERAPIQVRERWKVGCELIGAGLSAGPLPRTENDLDLLGRGTRRDLLGFLKPGMIKNL